MGGLNADNSKRLMRYYTNERTVAGKVLDARPTVEEYKGELYGVLECKITEPLSDSELNKLMNYWRGQESDDWGENYFIHRNSGRVNDGRKGDICLNEKRLKN